jgi:hypothetical protein
VIKEFTVQGTWSFPSYSADEFCGTFTYAPSSGGFLRLSSLRKNIKELFKHVMSPKRQQEIILGKTSAGLMTLIDSECLGLPPQILADDEATIELAFHTKKILGGNHFKQLSEIKFKRLIVKYTHLDEWALTSGIDLSVCGNDEFDYVLTFKLPKSTEGKISQFKSVNNLQISIVPDEMPPIVFRTTKQACITQFYKVIIETSDLADLETLEEILYVFRNFVSLAVSEQVFPFSIEAQSETDPTGIIEIFYQLPHFANNVPDVSPSDMLFTLPDIGERFEEIINDWFEKADLLEPVVDLFFGIRHNPYVYNIHSFLSLVQALETYHVRFAQKYKLDGTANNQLLSTVNRFYQDPYDTKWSRDPMPLLRRIIEIIYYYTEISGAVCGGGLVDFAKKVADSRNYYTHYDPTRPQLKQRVAHGNELLIVATRLELILEVCLMSELGFAKDEITKAVMKKRSLLEALDRGIFPSSKTPFSKL